MQSSIIKRTRRREYRNNQWCVVGVGESVADLLRTLVVYNKRERDLMYVGVL
jgi:hypothetical protein